MPFAHINEFPPVSIAEALSSKPGIVDLWYYFYEGTTDPGLLAAHHALMSADEKERHRRFHFERDRRMFLATRALVRTVLSSYCSVVPADWQFTTGEHGKPRVNFPEVTPSIHFNLANTKGLVVCAVSIVHESVGVDTECIDREVESVRLADRFFSPSEAAALRLTPASERLQRFFTYWTLKESYIKARGLGLAAPLDQFSFSMSGDSVSIAFDPLLRDNANHWRFAVLDASPRHRIAVAANTGGGDLSLRTMDADNLILATKGT